MSRRKNRPPRLPLPVRGGIRAQARRRAPARHWWGRRWLALLESFQLGARLGRGRSYACAGQVAALEVAPGEITARVQGANREAYRCEIRWALPSPAARDSLLAALRARPLLQARLLLRELPREIEALFQAAGEKLFPAGREDLEMRCSCPDWFTPCKHLAAVHFLWIEAIDHDPLLLLALRGLGRGHLLPGTAAAEREGPAGDDGPDTRPAAGEPDAAMRADDFWGAGDQPEEPAFGPAPAEGPAAPLARRLGPLRFWRGEDRFLDAIGQASARAAAAGWRVWAGEQAPFRRRPPPPSSPSRSRRRGMPPPPAPPPADPR